MGYAILRIAVENDGAELIKASRSNAHEQFAEIIAPDNRARLLVQHFSWPFTLRKCLLFKRNLGDSRKTGPCCKRRREVICDAVDLLGQLPSDLIGNWIDRIETSAAQRRSNEVSVHRKNY